MTASGHDSKEEKKSTPKKIDMQKVLTDGALATGYYALHGGGNSPSDDYARDFDKSHAAKEFKRLAQEVRDSKGVPDDKKEALAAQYDQLSVLTKEWGMAAVSGNTELFKKKEAEAKAAYEALRNKAADVSEEEKKKAEGLEASIVEQEHKAIARMSRAHHERGRTQYLREKIHSVDSKYQAYLAQVHHMDRHWHGPKAPETKPSAEAKMSGASAEDSTVEPGWYTNPHKNYSMYVDQERDKDGNPKPGGMMTVKCNRPPDSSLWGAGYYDDGSVIMSVVAMLRGGRDEYARQYRDQVDGMIALLKPGRDNLLKTVEGKEEKQLKAKAGYVMDPLPKKSRGNVPPDLQFFWVQAAFEQVKKVDPPIPFNDSNRLHALKLQVAAGPMFSGIGGPSWDQFKTQYKPNDNSLTAQFFRALSFVGVKSGSFASYLKPGDAHMVRANNEVLKVLEGAIATHNEKVRKQLVDQEKSAIAKAKELADERKYLDGVEARGRREEKKEDYPTRFASMDAEQKAIEERKHYIELGAKAEIKEILDAKAPDEKLHVVKVQGARDELQKAIDHIGNFNPLGSEGPPTKPPAAFDWKECFAHPLPGEEKAFVAQDHEEAWRRARDWAARGEPLDCKEVERYLSFCGQQLKKYSQAYDDACQAWKAVPAYAQYEEHSKLWESKLDTVGMGRILDTPDGKTMEEHKLERVQADVNRFKQFVSDITSKPADTTELKAESKAESPVQIAAEITKLELQVAKIKQLSESFDKALAELKQRPTPVYVDRLMPPTLDVNAMKSNFQAVKDRALGIVKEIHDAAVDVNSAFKNYQRNKAVWNKKASHLDTRMEKLDADMLDQRPGPNPGVNVLEVKKIRDRENRYNYVDSHLYSQHFESIVERAYNTALEAFVKATPAILAAPTVRGESSATSVTPSDSVELSDLPARASADSKSVSAERATHDRVVGSPRR